MPFKIRKILTDRQLVKAKFSVSMAMVCFVLMYATSNKVANAELAESAETLEFGDFEWMGGKFVTKDTVTYDRGEIVYYSKNLEICDR
jgi:hypothetical protein